MTDPLFVVGSTNPVKLLAVEQVVTRFFPEAKILGLHVGSGVRTQPISNEETKEGAINRAKNCLSQNKNASFGVGIESGLEIRNDGLWALGWVAIINNDGILGLAKTAEFRLPNSFISHIQNGLELGEVDAVVFKRTDSGEAEGAVGFLTQGKINRVDVLHQAIIFALVPFLNPEYYSLPRAQSSP